MVPLNLPSFEYRIKNRDGKVFIFDEVRKKFVVLTPEEWVRQHFIHYMINHLRYPRALIKVETGLQFNRLRKRSDIVLHNRIGSPWMIVECKSPDHKIGPKAVRQVSAYNTSIKAKYIVLTNGLTTICVLVDLSNKSTEVIRQLPEFE
jgi:hypothetical protein